MFAGAMLPVRPAGRRRHRPVLVLDQQPADAARRRCRGAGGRRVPARQRDAGRSPPPAPRRRRTATRTASAGVIVHAGRGPTNNRRLKVTITGPVGTYFARAVGITTWPAAATPRPTSSCPCRWAARENYYGVGFYEGRVPTTTTTDQPATTPTGTDRRQSRRRAASGPTPDVRRRSTNDDVYTTEDTNGERQQWRNFGLGRDPCRPTATLVIDGLEGSRLQDVND